jgi:hypothetical protein
MRLLNIILLAVFIAGSSFQDETPKCKGIKKDGTACRSVIVSKKTGYCNAHDPNKPKCAKETCRMKVKEKGQYCRFHKP